VIFQIPTNIAIKFNETLTQKNVIDLIVVKSNISPYIHFWRNDNTLHCEVHEEPTNSNLNDVLKELEKWT